jgi:hypothetical protein
VPQCPTLYSLVGNADVKLGLLTLLEEHRLRVFNNKVLRKIFELKRDEVTGG